MQIRQVVLISSLAAMLVSGCATMSPDQCMVADWYRLGEQDAMAGRSSNYLADRAGACQEAGFQSDTDAWYAGFEDALPSFCTLDNGFRFGVDGNRYRDTCPAGLSAEFLEGFEVGSEIYSLDQQVADLQRGLNNIQSEIQRTQNSDSPNLGRIADLQDDLVDVMDDLRVVELELATVRGVAIGRGFNVPR